ncbi:hypothetical protein RIF29_03695 [Crotalaria pallida]|uniref:Uncharacterized protein n=1 Tax=Crotalaria pallida TaxID=3830 RepID=A0AAN9J074_CROPI
MCSSSVVRVSSIWKPMERDGLQYGSDLASGRERSVVVNNGEEFGGTDCDSIGRCRRRRNVFKYVTNIAELNTHGGKGIGKLPYLKCSSVCSNNLCEVDVRVDVSNVGSVSVGGPSNKRARSEKVGMLLDPDVECSLCDVALCCDKQYKDAFPSYDAGHESTVARNVEACIELSRQRVDSILSLLQLLELSEGRKKVEFNSSNLGYSIKEGQPIVPCLLTGVSNTCMDKENLGRFGGTNSSVEYNIETRRKTVINKTKRDLSNAFREVAGNLITLDLMHKIVRRTKFKIALSVANQNVLLKSDKDPPIQ